MYAAAEQEACCQSVESGHVSGTKAWNAFVSPQVTPLAPSLGQECRSVRIYASELCPRQDSNLRSRLRRPLLCTALIWPYVLRRGTLGRVWGAETRAGAGEHPDAMVCVVRMAWVSTTLPDGLLRLA